MKRTTVALTAALSIIAGAVHSPPVSAQEVIETETSGSSFSSSQGNSSEGPVIAFIAVATALGGGVLWAVQQGLIPNPLSGVIPGAPQPGPAPAPSRGDCSARAFNDALWEWRDSAWTDVEYCDGRFAWVAQDRTDWRVAFEFDGQRWKISPTRGTTKTGMMQGCYNGIELRSKGASEDFISRLPICTPDEIGYSPW